jgi:hypothetical protein
MTSLCDRVTILEAHQLRHRPTAQDFRRMSTVWLRRLQGSHTEIMVALPAAASVEDVHVTHLTRARHVRICFLKNGTKMQSDLGCSVT